RRHPLRGNASRLEGAVRLPLPARRRAGPRGVVRRGPARHRGGARRLALTRRRGHRPHRRGPVAQSLVTAAYRSTRRLVPCGALNCTSIWVFSPCPATSVTVPIPKESWAKIGRAQV